MLITMPTMANLDVVKSPIDEKEYRYLELKNNLKVLLISDPAADKSAASLDVNVGNGSDPDEWGGLAHFLEHMLFLGTEKYPDADEYQSFIKQNGGSNNAYTSFDHTNYYFSISPPSFEQALDRFSRFFIDPTFDEIYVDRERSVVHSEYQARKKDEGRRLWDAQKTWLNPQHPASRFSVGSLETLRDREAQSVRDALIDFYESHYSANIMTLVVLSNESLDQLESWIVDKFSAIPDNGAKPERFTQDYLNPALLPARLDTIPDKNIHALSFIFPVPSTYDEYRTKPLGYISNLLGHEGKGSLHAVLKDKGWIESLSAGPGYTDRIHGIFTIRIGLTESGLEHIDQIAQLLFAEIDLIKTRGIEKWRFDEQRELSNIAFRFAQERDAGRVAQSLSARLHHYSAEDVLQGSYMMSEFDAPRIRELLGYLNPDNVNLQVTSQKLDANQVTPRYEVRYSLKKIDSETRTHWKPAAEVAQLNLPDKNPFVAARLNLILEQAVDDDSVLPEKIDSIHNADLWYAYDNSFNTPRANFYVNIQSLMANDSANHAVLSELFVRLVNDQLNEFVYPAYLADVNYSFYRHGRGVSIRLSGFENRQSALLSLVLEAIQNLEFTNDRFAIVKKALIRDLQNVEKESPSSQTLHEVYRLVMLPYWSEEKRLSELTSIDAESVRRFKDKLFDKIRITILAIGDISKESAVNRAKLVEDRFVDSEFIDEVTRPTVRALMQGMKYLRTLNVDHTDSALVTYFQGHEASRRERAKMSLLKSALESPFYHYLRTVNRVGYLVHSGLINIDRWPGLFFAVQSPSHNPLEIDDLYHTFLQDFEATLNEMSETQWNGIKQGLIDKILRAPTNLDERTSKFWRQIDLQELQFNSRKLFASEVENLSKNDISGYLAELTKTHSAILQVQSPGEKVDETGMLTTGIKIGSTEDFTEPLSD